MMASASAIDAIDQLLDGRHVVDQAHDHAAAPGTGIHIAVDHDLGIDARDLVEDVVDLRHLAVLALLREQPFDALVVQHALGAAQRPHHKPRVELGRIDNRLLDVVMRLGEPAACAVATRGPAFATPGADIPNTISSILELLNRSRCECWPPIQI